MRMLIAVTALIGLTAFSTQAAPAGGDSDSATMVQPSTDMAKTGDTKSDEDKKKDEKTETDTSKMPDDSAPTAAQPNVMPQDQDKQPMQPAPGQEPSPNPGRPHA
jgi:hypothetical protein